MVASLQQCVEHWKQEIRGSLLCKSSLEAILNSRSSVLEKDSFPYVVVPFDLGIDNR